jgi:hypothetical protein
MMSLVKIITWQLLGGLILGGGLLAGVMSYWYPYPYRILSIGQSLIVSMVLVDVVLTTALTSTLYKKSKSKRERSIDLALICLIRIVALSFGINALAAGRPIALIFEVDRFRVVSRADLAESPVDLPSMAVDTVAHLPVFAVRGPRDENEKLLSINQSLSGLEPGQRPDWWIDYRKGIVEIAARAKPLARLREMHPAEDRQISESVRLTGKKDGELVWLPLVSGVNDDWSILLDSRSHEIIGFVRVDGFSSVTK